MRRTAIKPKLLYQLTKEYIKSRPRRTYPQGGRPRIYDDALILTIAAWQNLHQFSFREALEYCEDFFVELPTLSTYHYRLEQLSSDVAQGFIEYLGTKIAQNAPKRVRFCIMDGTGFSYSDCYPMRLFRGTEIRQIAAHTKVVTLAGVYGQHRYVISALAGPPYASEIRLVRALLAKLPAKTIVLGDKGYDCLDIMETIVQQRCHPAIAIKQGRRGAIQDPLRLRSKRNADNPAIYKKRTLIEGLFGNIKQKMSSHVRVFSLHIAQIFVLLRLALFNVARLISLVKDVLILVWFSNSARAQRCCSETTKYAHFLSS